MPYGTVSISEKIPVWPFSPGPFHGLSHRAFLPSQSPSASRFSSFRSTLGTDAIPSPALASLLVLISAYSFCVPLAGHSLIWVFSFGGRSMTLFQERGEGNKMGKQGGAENPEWVVPTAYMVNPGCNTKSLLPRSDAWKNYLHQTVHLYPSMRHTTKGSGFSIRGWAWNPALPLFTSMTVDKFLTCLMLSHPINTNITIFVISLIPRHNRCSTNVSTTVGEGVAQGQYMQSFCKYLTMIIWFWYKVTYPKCPLFLLAKQTPDNSHGALGMLTKAPRGVSESILPLMYWIIFSRPQFLHLGSRWDGPCESIKV